MYAQRLEAEGVSMCKGASNLILVSVPGLATRVMRYL